MDVGSLAATAMMSHASFKGQAIAQKIMKDNVESQQAVVDLLQESAASLEKLVASAGPLGGKLDVTV